MMRPALRPVVLALAVWAALLAAPSLARAQDARTLVDQGLRALDLTHWDDAIAAFERAYQLEPEPDVLGLLGDAYRAKGDCARAAHAYRTNLELKPRTRRKQELAERLAEMDACVAGAKAEEDARVAESTRLAEEMRRKAKAEADRKAAESRRAEDARDAAARDPGAGASTSASTSTSTSTPPTTTVAVAPPAARPGRTKRIAGLALAGAGAVAVGAGVFLGLAASNRADEVEAHLAANGSVWDATAADLERRGERLETASVIALGVGGVAVVGGVVLYVLGARDGRAAERRPLVRLGRGEAIGGWSWAF